ncbi:hypothetical protein G9272_02030 [Streptomyces asoensis]|uniref:Fibronectin type-III domain-containing protein n=1 Tax=Streptomyces asoensis TaxID=249586 RepID=A0A6M4WFK1_9ACTN|nr:hypothetical protein G9272_02030 [Streptomyces asoensis]
MSFGTRSRAVLVFLGTLGLALAAASPSIAADRTPTVPTDLFNGRQSCSTDADRPTYLWAGTGLGVEGIPGTTDTTDNSLVTAQYRVWPVVDPNSITTATRPHALPGIEAPATLSAAALTDGQTYAWQAQTVADGTASDWSAACYVTIDNTRPATTPTFSSANYQQDVPNPGGAPAKFTLSADGDDDVTGFEYAWLLPLPIVDIANIGDHGIPQFVDPYSKPTSFMRADAPGGSATVSLVPPSGSGPKTLWVRSLDRAFNGSEITSYMFFVSPTVPSVTPAVSSPEFGEPTEFTLRPAPGLQSTNPVVSYSVRTIGGQIYGKPVEVAADTDGTAKVTVVLDGIYGEALEVTGKSGDGWVSDTGRWSSTYDTTPTVVSDIYPENGSGGGVGVPGSFTFTPKVKDVVSYTYSVNGDPEATVTAGDDHSATIDWTPASDGFYDLQVYATTSSGVQLAPYDYYFTVN